MCALATTLFLSSVPAYAAPASKLEQARAVKAQIDALDIQVSKADENYNDARIAHAKIAVQQKKAAGRVAAAEKRIGVLQSHLNTRARDMYRNGPLGFVDVLLGSRSFEQFSSLWDILKKLNRDDARSVEDLKAAREEAKAAHAELSQKEAAAARQVKIMAANEASIKAKLDERKRMLNGIEAEIAQIEAEQEARDAARVGNWLTRGDKQFPPPTRAARSEVVDVAKRYLGAPYVWGASGPNSFDCSGFTMFVYRQVGVSLPHSSRAQFGSGERVSRSDLQPGDLVFFGSPIHHVGIYVGGGMYIHAPHSGDVVKISPLDRGDYAGAVRP